jgi:hypothetical protein
MRLAIVTEEKADLEIIFHKVKELRRQVCAIDVGGSKKRGSGLKAHRGHSRVPAGPAQFL